MTELQVNNILPGFPSSFRALSPQHGSGGVAPPHVTKFNLKLHDDILWYIFLVNADMGDDEEGEIVALNTLRHSSQVCSTWRRLIVSSSSLWGRVINLNFLRGRKWREEVMRRTADALLCVLGIGSPGLVNIEEIVVSLLDQHWARIRYLVLDFNRSRWRPFEDQIWSIFQRPTYVLETFGVSLFTNDGQLEPVTSIFCAASFVIFNDLAPSLRTFHAPNISFSLAAPWLSHIRLPALNAPIPVQSLLGAMTRMPLLEILEDEVFSSIVHGDMSASLPKAAAISLRTISVVASEGISPYMDFLAHLEPSAQCCLSFSTSGYRRGDTTIPNSEALIAAAQTLYRYSRFGGLAGATDIYLVLYGNNFHFEAGLPSTTFCFNIDISDSGLDFESNVIKTLFEALPFYLFHNVQTLTLAIDSDSEILSQDATFKDFILSVSSVKELNIYPEFLRYFLVLPSEVLTAAFPTLRKIHFLACPNGYQIGKIKRFLTLRIVGNLIHTLSIQIKHPHDHLDIRDFEEFIGLRVVFMFKGGKEKEYLCGSGRPKELQIARQARPKG